MYYYDRYEWVDVGMLDYDPTTKLYHVKRVCVPNHILERNAAVGGGGGGEGGEGGRRHDNETDDEGAGRVSDGEQKAEAPEESARADGAEKKEVSYRHIDITVQHSVTMLAIINLTSSMCMCCILECLSI